MSGTTRMVFVGQRPVDALTVSAPGRLAAVVSCEGGAETTLVADRLGVPVVSLEQLEPARRVWSGASVCEAADALLHTVAGVRDDVLAYASSGALTRTVQSIGAVLRAPAGSVADRVNDKLATRHALAHLGLPVPAWFATHAGTLSAEQAARRVGVPFVVQRAHGSCGATTWIVHHAEQVRSIRDALLPHERLLVSRFVQGAILNVHVLVSRTGVVTSPPSVQGTGVPELSSSATAYCGNDFGAAAGHDEEVRRRLHAHAHEIGRWLATIGYRGACGVDFALSATEAHPLEVNPRLQGSSWLLAELGRERGLSFGSLHLAVCDELPPPGTPRSPSLLDGAYLILRHDGDEAPGALAPGVYAFTKDDELVWRRAGLSPTECSNKEIVLGGIPHPAAQTSTGAVVARISAPRSLLQKDGRTLTLLGRRAVLGVRAALAARAQTSVSR